MNKMKRILLIVVCLMLCISTVMIPSVARYPCTNPNGHVYEHTSHGSGIPFSGTDTTCPGINYYQCVTNCKYCGDSNLENHTEGGGSHSWDSMPRDPETGYYRWKCSKCGAFKSA